MKKETTKKLKLNKIKIADLNQTTKGKQKWAPTTTVITSRFTIC